MVDGRITRIKNSRFKTVRKSVNDFSLARHVEPGSGTEFNSYYVEDGDYWKIDNITLGYSSRSGR